MNRRDRSRGSRHKGRSRSRDSKSGKVDLRSKISTMRRKRESRDRSVSPLHSIVHKVIDNKIRRLGSKSPPRRISSDSKNDDRKSYQKYMNERSDFLKKLQEEEEEESRHRRSRTREDRKSRKEEKRSKKSKKSHRSDRKERKRSRERSKKRSTSRDKARTSKEREKTETGTSEEKQVNKDDGFQGLPLQSEDQKENNGVNIEGETTKVETDLREEKKIDENEKKDEDDEDDFDDFNEAELSSLSSSSLSLSSIEEVTERVISPLDGWKNNGYQQNPRLSDSPPMPARRHSQSRSRSRSRPYDHPKSKSRSISPPAFLPSSSTWESRVSEFVRSIGGVPNRSPTFLESIPGTSNQPLAVPNFPPPPVISYVQVPASLNVPPPFSVVPNPEAVNLPLPPPAPPIQQMGTELNQFSRSFPNGSSHQDIENPTTAKQLPVTLQKSPPSPDEEEPQPEEITLTPLIKFIGQKLADKKLTNLMSLRKGFFRYNLLSVASR
jgi:hypothetical protein